MATNAFALDVSAQAPRLPRSDLAVGSIWPAGGGARDALRRFEADPGAGLPLLFEDRWSATGSDRWQISSPEHATYDQPEGQRLLVEWARFQSGFSALLSPSRISLLAEDGSGGWRLWQLMRVPTNLMERLVELHSLKIEQQGDLLLDTVAQLRRSVHFVESQLGLLATLETVAPGPAGPVYAGPLPPSSWAGFAEPRDEVQVLEEEMAPLLEGLVTEGVIGPWTLSRYLAERPEDDSRLLRSWLGQMAD